jgi:hypothetical protein
VTDDKGAPFKGILIAPQKPLTTDIPKLPEEYGYVAGVKVGSVDGTALRFSKPFSLTIPFESSAKPSAGNFKVFFHDSTSGKLVLAGNGGVLNSYRTAITVEVDHMSLFVVINTKGQKVDSIPLVTDQGTSTAPAATEESPSKVGTVPPLLLQPVPPFRDTRGHWAEDFIDQLRKRGVVSGKSDGIYDPSGNLTRAEFTKIALNAFQIPASSSVEENLFDDTGADQWYARYVAAAKEYGIIEGYPYGTFRPNNPISRVEALKVVLETSGLEIGNEPANFVDTVTGSWYEKYVSYASKHGLLSPVRGASFEPERPILRSEMAQVVAKLWALIQTQQ